MAAKLLLIVSTSLSTESLLQPPFSLNPEHFLLCTYDSLRFLGFSRFQAVILHQPSEDLLQKLSLGIRDQNAAEALWHLLASGSHPAVHILMDSSAKPPLLREPVASVSGPPQPCSALGIEALRAGELRQLVDTAGSAPSWEYSGSAETGSPKVSNESMTADDIRELHQQGKQSISSDRPMTPWAREVANSLGMMINEPSKPVFLVEISAQSISELMKRSENFHSWHFQKSADVRLIISPPLIPIFNERFPALRGMVVAPSCHWEEKGAFTGEISGDMLMEAGCHGFILPNLRPYNLPANIKKTVTWAARKGLSLFCTFSLDQISGCDIMTAQANKTSGTPGCFKMKDCRNQENFRVESGIACLISEKDMAALSSGKGANKRD